MNTENISLLNSITTFINEIGIPCKEGSVREDSFLQGVDIINGGIVYDAQKLLSPGDLLHEAGHVAVLTKSDRIGVTSPEVSGDMEPGGVEMAAIAWSWAALKYLGIAPEIVFHKEGYKGDSEVLIDNFSNGRFIGASLLQWMGMTNTMKEDGTEIGIVYPAMMHWLRQN